MKNIVLTAFSLIFFAHLDAQITDTFSSGRIQVIETDSMSHDSTQCVTWTFVNYVFTINSSFVNDSVSIIDTAYGFLVGGPYYNTSGVSPWTFSVPITNQGYSDQNITPTGGYQYFSLSQFKVTAPSDTLRYITYYDSIWVLPCLWSYVTGNVYIDNNTNCAYDPGIDSLFNYFPVVVNDSLSSPTADWYYIYGGGGYGYSAPVQQSWMTSCTISLPPSWAFLFPFSPCFTGSGVYRFTTVPQTGVDFPLLCSGSVDVQVYALSPGRVRLHSPFIMHPYVSNIGCDTQSGTMTLVLDSRVTYNSALSTNPADTVRGDTLIWTYTALSNVSAGAYWNSFMSGVYLTPDSTLVAGDTLCFQVYANIPPTDINPANNYYSICLPVVYSYDPNSKDVSPAGTGPGGELPAGIGTLTYTINFQNTGSDTAYNINVIDTLNSHVNPKTLRVLGTSANMSPAWLAPNVVEFSFQDIMLPDSAENEPASHGQVQFSIQLDTALPYGTVVTNTAYVYFDSNPAVVTNTTTSTTTIPAGTQMITTPSGIIRVYPNPVSDQLFVDGFNNGTISIFSLSGAMLTTQQAVSDKTVIDVSNLPPGMYLLKTVNDASSSTVKFVKY